MCSTITIDAGASDAASEAGEAGPDLDGGGTGLDVANDNVGLNGGTNDGSLEVPTDISSDGGCSCSTPGRSGSHRPLAALLALAAFICDRRRRRPLP
jgi:hypothetical protein